MNNLVAIVGRPNVGKSTLFNRLTESKEAIVDPVSGVTRDRKYGNVHWGGRDFTIIDTGGYITNSDDSFEGEIREQVSISIEEAAIILFVVDVHTGITDLDMEVTNILRRAGKPIMVVSNKVDTGDKEIGSTEFYSLGLSDKVYSISASNGYGTGELLDDLIGLMPPEPEEEESKYPKIAVVGRPNVGKSTFINTLLGEKRNIVSDIAGTTRDSVHTIYKGFGFEIEIIDTAGLRKRKKIDDSLEYYSAVRTIKAIDQADVCLLLLEAPEGVNKQDQAIFYQIVESFRGVVILANKWDLVDKDHSTHDQMREVILKRIEPFTDVPIIFTSNVTKQRVIQGLEEAMRVYENRKRKVSTSQLNDFILPIINDNPPPALKGKYIQIKYVTQIPSQVPTFAFFCNLPQYIRDPYKRFLENQLRERFDFTGTPIRLFFRKK
ncbi:ribosome biogenesis GTPase Der [Sanyastnella coralliicola]|uniref:ribosome biogenesis GTPase Der n=1 Tax=Sanyastnella coralliicola TaxID=3069118 RepID=UPI0027BAD0DA|nr:ribosome biogenesis GTPase Der [Longitalea sp. SCSIO 12813]